ncbi:hypothetical protein [Secundilactobacillus paracollinoides]|uniref:hypothetical protein n=2 Tax=Secundilactobacillus paracollinoides TaxID=240427 RepID=UPI000704BE4F|nr:hypothetical protein [Secundilactobacillus paracollinoides]
MEIWGSVLWLGMMIFSLSLPGWGQGLVNSFLGKPNGDWLSFWGAYFGAVLTVGGSFIVWFMQHTIDRFKSRKDARPKLSFNYRFSLNKDEIVYSNRYEVPEFDKSVNDKDLVAMTRDDHTRIRLDNSCYYKKHGLLELNNLGPTDMYNCNIVLNFKNAGKEYLEKFQVASINARNSAIVIPTPIFYDYKNTDFYLEKMTVFYYTKDNEKAMSVFENNGILNIEARPKNIFGSQVCSDEIDNTAASNTRYFKVKEQSGPKDPTIQPASKSILDGGDTEPIAEPTTTTTTTTTTTSNPSVGKTDKG